MALITSVDDAYLEGLMFLPQYSQNPNKVMGLLCALRDKGDTLSNSFENYCRLMRYFAALSQERFAEMLDSVSALASDDELSLLVGVQLTLKTQSRLETISGRVPD